MNADGTNQQRVVEMPRGSAVRPRWSPTGDRLVFVHVPRSDAHRGGGQPGGKVGLHRRARHRKNDPPQSMTGMSAGPRRWLDRLLHLHDTPRRTAAAFALGVFFSFSPLHRSADPVLDDARVSVQAEPRRRVRRPQCESALVRRALVRGRDAGSRRARTGRAAAGGFSRASSRSCSAIACCRATSGRTPARWSSRFSCRTWLARPSGPSRSPPSRTSRPPPCSSAAIGARVATIE